MYKFLRRLFFCNFNFHVRSRKLVIISSTVTSSQCKYCGQAMRKLGNGKWQAWKV